MVIVGTKIDSKRQLDGEQSAVSATIDADSVDDRMRYFDRKCSQMKVCKL